MHLCLGRNIHTHTDCRFYDTINMTDARLAIFDDQRGQWGPLTDLRAVFDLRTGMLTTLERLALSLHQPPAALLVPDPLADITRDAHPAAAINTLDVSPPPTHWLLVHAGVSTPASIEKVKQLTAGQALLDAQGRLAAAYVTHTQAQHWLNAKQWHTLPGDINPASCGAIDILQYPWDIQAQLDDTLRHDLLASDVPIYNAATRPVVHNVATAGSHPIKVSTTAKLHPMVVINAEKGPVVIDDHAVLGSFAVVAGPCYIGKKTIIAPATHVRASCSIGPSCVVGGEVSATLFQGFSNKAHAGYLGNSIVGQWVNLGADTNASNLKNTYGHVRMSLEANTPACDSKLTKLGPLIGDYVRTAIGSRLMTGSVIGTGAMLAVSDFAPKCIERFAFLTDGSCEHYDVEKFVETARYMMSRRDVALSDALEKRLRHLMTRTTVV